MPNSNNFFICLNFLNLGIASIIELLKNKAQTLKYLKCKAPFLLLILLPLVAQNQNLVPNPSFEEYLECPYAPAELQNQVINWYSWQETPDFFHPCSNDLDGFAGVPNNAWGYQWPISGDAYAAIATYAFTTIDIREYMAVELLEPMDIGTSYYVMFHASFRDSINSDPHLWCASNNIGMRFFQDPEYNNQTNPLTPDNYAHVNYSEILNDYTNWTKIEGWVFADQPYNWLAIGNFFTDDNTEIEILNNVNSCISLYYIENVCVAKTPGECDYLLNQTQISNSINLIEIYPNPVDTRLQVKSNNQLIYDIKVFNTIGQLIYWSNQHKKVVVIETDQWSVGLYILEVKTEDGFIKPFKVLKQ